MNNVSLISAIVSLAGAVTTAVLGGVFEWRRRRADREQTRRDLVSRFGEPLVQASVLLAWRLRNAIDLFSGKPVKQTPLGADRQDDYNLYETLYRLAAFLGWVEILYRDAHFLDLGNRRRNRRFLHRLAAADSAIAGGSGPDAPFVLLSGERRAIGEVMVAPDTDPARCLGYVEFRRRYESDEEFRRWFVPAVDQLRILVETKPAGAVRQLTHAHNTLIELVDFLDPRKAWINTPRDKLELTKG
ncbi:hypothetical protein FXN61_02010 [Lentzea sp. PSKA42]|uniref:Uncharacterized protein n=1 Tax=Lentzea indica TaxID=2604800 RepID=A0ABX1FAE5_9PSEU|nr:hypothetical protein [Lentzea indica]NKE55663.1 hypothetical protein [Lentzea indica]